MPVIHAK
ncbi:hypothetical protein YPPY53_3282, partial [Yersinia pestis PY-53]